MEKDDKIKERNIFYKKEAENLKKEKIKFLYQDKTKPLKDRQADYNSSMEKMMNPIPAHEFNPDDFEPMGEDMKAVANRDRVMPPKILPTCGIKPKKIREGQMVGNYESKQDIYLTLAHRINELQAEIDLLKTKIT